MSTSISSLFLKHSLFHFNTKFLNYTCKFKTEVQNNNLINTVSKQFIEHYKYGVISHLHKTISKDESDKLKSKHSLSSKSTNCTQNSQKSTNCTQNSQNTKPCMNIRQKMLNSQKFSSKIL